jgi:hypothetical protein
MTGNEPPVIRFCTMLEVGRRAGAELTDRAELDRRPVHWLGNRGFVFRVRLQAREAPRTPSARTVVPSFGEGWTAVLSAFAEECPH